MSMQSLCTDDGMKEVIETYSDMIYRIAVAHMRTKLTEYQKKATQFYFFSYFYSSSSSIVLIPLGCTIVEKTICVCVSPNTCNFPINRSNSCVLIKATLSNIEEKRGIFMDKIDKKLISLLQENARYSLKQLAEQVYLYQLQCS